MDAVVFLRASNPSGAPGGAWRDFILSPQSAPTGPKGPFRALKGALTSVLHFQEVPQGVLLGLLGHKGAYFTGSSGEGVPWWPWGGGLFLSGLTAAVTAVSLRHSYDCKRFNEANSYHAPWGYFISRLSLRTKNSFITGLTLHFS